MSTVPHRLGVRLCLRTLRIQAHGGAFATIVAVGLFGASGACDGRARDCLEPTAATKIPSTCIPTDADVVPSHMALTGATFTFCLATLAGTAYCFTADLEAKTIAPAAPPTDASGDNRIRKNRLWGEGNPMSASIGPSAHGKGLTVCTSDKAACHDLPIDAARNGDKPIAVSDDATLVAIDTRSYRPNDTQKSPGRLETWDAVSGKKLASFEMHYGPDGLGFDHPVAVHSLQFLGYTVIAFTDPPC